MNSESLVAKVWNFANVLRDQGVSYQAYISQISCLLFLKMDEERVELIGRAVAPGRRFFMSKANKRRTLRRSADQIGPASGSAPSAL